MSLRVSTPCTVCSGTGQAALFTSLMQCPSCDGLGWWLAEDYKVFFEELYETRPELLRAIAEFYLEKLKGN